MADREEKGLSSSTSGSMHEHHGIVRKRSIRRKISRDESIKEIPYGIYPDEYDKICERVNSEKHFRNAIEALKEKWRMLSFMYDDCMEMVKEWEGKQLNKKQERTRQRLYIYLSVTSIVAVPVLLLLIFICWCIF